MHSLPQGRFRATLNYHLRDYGFLRILWTNLYEIAPGVWRSNQPGPGRMARYAAMGLRDIVILRGPRNNAAYDLECARAQELGIRLHLQGLQARAAPEPEQILEFLKLAHQLPKPWLMHCKSGADRAGLASALYLLSLGRPLEEARQQMSWRFVHLKSTKTGILDVLLDHYEEATRARPMTIEEWARTTYDPGLLTREFAQGRRHGRRWPT